ncbi:MAG: energy-dependent translational throttle protein EttA [Lentisphaerae bacterium]|jgi:ATP-binding cassette ChvD family protein|nr:energy-dependent translational throttle protein EttA [Lentisphaerota bacterium]
MAQQFVFHMQGMSKFYGDKCVLQNFNLSFYYGAKIGIVGENGSGKSTLLRIMAGLDRDIQGEAEILKGYRALLVPQEPKLNPEKTVRGNLEEAMAPIQALIDRYDEVMEQMGEEMTEKEQEKLNDEFDFLQNEIDRLDGWNIDHQLEIASSALVLPPDDADVTKLSGGERRRVALCKALLEKPDLLLLDEPTNHLDAETITWLEKTLNEYEGTVIIVTHDRYFLDKITKWILEIENGRGLPFEGNYSSWLAQKQELLRVLEKKETARQRFLAQELEWINSTPEARRKKSQARVTRYEELASQKFEVKQDDVTIQIPPGPRLGDRVLEVSNLCKSYGNRKLIDQCSFSLPRGGVVGVIGPNGVGKTTLFKMIVGEETPDSGSLTLGETVQLSYVDQHRDALDDSKTVYEEISAGNEELQLGDRRINSRAYLSRFNFRGSQQQKLVGNLSGGERNRVHLAKLLRTGGNLLLLDEPTNDLDVNTMRVLEEALCAFPGCAMVISHDRFFLDRICTHLLIFEGNGKVSWFEGNYETYVERVLKGDSEHFLNRRVIV